MEPREKTQIIYANDFERWEYNDLTGGGTLTRARDMPNPYETEYDGQVYDFQNQLNLGGVYFEDDVHMAVDAGETIRLSQSVSAQADHVTVTFDFLQIDNWTGEKAAVSINGTRHEFGAFSSQTVGRDTSATAPTGVETSVDHTKHADFHGSSTADQTFAVSFTIPQSMLAEGVLDLEFSSMLEPGLNTASWGIDNLEISETFTIRDNIRDATNSLEALAALPEIASNGLSITGIRNAADVNIYAAQNQGVDILNALNNFDDDFLQLSDVELSTVAVQGAKTLTTLRDTMEQWQEGIWRSAKTDLETLPETGTDDLLKFMTLLSDFAGIATSLSGVRSAVNALSDAIKKNDEIATNVKDAIFAAVDVPKTLDLKWNSIKTYFEDEGVGSLPETGALSSDATSVDARYSGFAGVFDVLQAMAQDMLTRDEVQADGINLSYALLTMQDELDDLASSFAFYQHLNGVKTGDHSFDAGFVESLGFDVDYDYSTETTIRPGIVGSSTTTDTFEWTVNAEQENDFDGVDIYFDQITVTEIASAPEWKPEAGDFYGDGTASTLDETAWWKAKNEYISLIDFGGDPSPSHLAEHAGGDVIL